MNIRPTASEMRLIKDSCEIAKMKQSAEIPANAHKKFYITASVCINKI